MFDPARLAQEIGQRYIDYLKTTFAFRDPELRQSFEAALDAGTLTDGPWLESTPVFQRTCLTRELLRDAAGPEVDPGFLAALEPTRLLYAHQEQAIRRLASGRNVIVATGTGSGKTEAFLYPVLLDLYRQPRSAPGVRALILYPMNALANDQRRRLGGIQGALERVGSSFRFTFGRYTGETPENQNDSRRNARHHIRERLPGELVLRSEMREAPPDILLTNYSMLEYLLLRPNDSPLFDEGRGGTWQFLILDEAHQYGGTKGLEMAMLVRRLKQRLRDGGLGRHLRCVATSASLGGGPGDRGRLAAFAGELFGEPFDPEDVLLGDVMPPASTGGFALGPAICQELAATMRVGDDVTACNLLRRLSTERGIQFEHTEPSEGLHQVLAEDGRAAALRLALQEPARLNDVARRIFEDAPLAMRVRNVVDLVELLNRARDPETGNALLSVRYHFFLRALEGAFVSYLPEKRVTLTRGDPDAAETHGTWFEVALCRECGQHYFVGQRRGDTFREAVRDAGDEQFRVSYLRPVALEDAADASPDDSDVEEQAVKACRLCMRCGGLSRPAVEPVEPSCGHATSLRVIEQEVRKGQEDQALRCSACGYHGPDPVREVLHGNDGPNAVVATVLHRMLPEERRKVLAFADGRQEAAYFPVYLDETYSSARDRGLLLRTVRGLAGATRSELGPGDVAPQLAAHLREAGVVGPADTELRALSEAWKILLREMLTRGRRLSLEGVGLLQWLPKLPPEVKVPSALTNEPWGLDETDARALLAWSVDSLREAGAVELATPPGVTLSWTEDLDLEGQPQSAEIGAARGRVAWDGATTRRVSFLVRLLSRSPSAPRDERARRVAAQELLRHIWSVLISVGGEDPLLKRVGDARRANLKWWRVRPLMDADQVFRCLTCGHCQSVSIRGVCGRHRCPGVLEAVNAGAEDPGRRHYRRLYQESLPPKLRAEEHTAQIDHDEARAFQEDFAEGRIHLLSSSTTFELGVDLGDLDTVFLRNVPPEPFNYAQRVGRAGRRAGRPGFAVTYCRRRPHDLVHFADPTRMMSGRTRPPVLRLTNAKIVSRHVTTFVLSDFFRAHPERFASVDALFGLSTGGDSVRATDLVHAHGLERRREIESRLREIVPSGLHGPLGIDDGRWMAVVAGTRLEAEAGLSQPSRLQDAEAELLGDYSQVRDLETLASSERRHKDAAWARARAETIAGEDVLSFLSRKAVIPKYGFPVDVVELDLHRTRRSPDADATKVSLQRDLAIAVAEYAPKGQVVANKRLWTSYALKKVPERAWPEYEYVRCNEHGFRTRPKGSSPEPCCPSAIHGHYIDPIFGFVTDRLAPPVRPSRKPVRSLTTRPYFVRSRLEAESVPMGGVATVRRASPGDLVVLCAGRKAQGFSICSECGAGESGSHRTPLGRPCPGGPVVRAALGHEFVTDVLRVQFVGASPPETAVMAADGLAWSLAYALLQGTADALDVPPADLNVTLNRSGEPLPEIVLYDNVPGGAGLVASLEAPPVFRAALEAARTRVDGRCGCAADTSCYGCLRSYSNQFAHASLARGAAEHYLGALLARWQER